MTFTHILELTILLLCIVFAIITIRTIMAEMTGFRQNRAAREREAWQKEEERVVKTPEFRRIR